MARYYKKRRRRSRKYRSRKSTSRFMSRGGIRL